MLWIKYKPQTNPVHLHMFLTWWLDLMIHDWCFQSSATKISESNPDDNKDDDDNDDDDDDDKLVASHDIDPERLKAFNVSLCTNLP